MKRPGSPDAKTAGKRSPTGRGRGSIPNEVTQSDRSVWNTASSLDDGLARLLVKLPRRASVTVSEWLW